MSSSTVSPRTTVDPKGIARLYLQKQKILPFLSSIANYCDSLRRKIHRKYRTLLLIDLFFSFAFMAGVMDQFDWFDDEEGVLVFMALLLVLAILIGILIAYAAAFSNLKRLKAKGLMLEQFFSHIIADIHPESGVKGYIDNAEEDSGTPYSKTYKTKKSPYSGAEKRYVKHTWGRFKIGLVDGSTLKVKCVDKLKKKSGSIVRFIEIQQGQLTFNNRLYLNPDNKPFILLRQELAQSEDTLLNTPVLHGNQMAKTCKTGFKGLHPRTDKPAAIATDSPDSAPTNTGELSSPTNLAIPRVIKTISPKMSMDELHKTLKQMLYNSHLFGIHYEDKKTHFEIEYGPDGAQKKTKIQLSCHQPSREEPFVKLKMAMPKGEPEQLLKANPTLAYGRFASAAVKGQPAQVFFIKTMLLNHLEQEELDTTIHGFAQLGSKLHDQAEFPHKLKALKQGRDTGWEKALLEKALRGVDADYTETEHKFKLTVRLPEQRQQSVHIRFDRQDADGNALIALQSYCGLPDQNKFKLCLEENEALSYGAIGIGKLGEQDYFVVTENQLAQTTDHQELRTAILQVAAKGDRLEKRLSAKDLH